MVASLGTSAVPAAPTADPGSCNKEGTIAHPGSQWATRLQKTAGPSGLASEDCSIRTHFHGFVHSNSQILQRGDLTVSISRSPAAYNHSQSLSVGPAHTDMALNSWSTEGVRPERTDYIFQGIFAYKDSPEVFTGSTYFLGNPDFLK